MAAGGALPSTRGPVATLKALVSRDGPATWQVGNITRIVARPMRARLRLTGRSLYERGLPVFGENEFGFDRFALGRV